MSDPEIMVRKRTYEFALVRVIKLRTDSQQAERRVDICREKLGKMQREAIESAYEAKAARKALAEAEAEFREAREAFDPQAERDWIAGKQ